MFNPRAEILLKCLRGTLVEEEHYGFRMLANSEKILDLSGETGHYPFYLRDCAIPLQAALIIDYGMDIKYDLTEQEIAICCATHSGEKIHTDVIKGLIEKIGIDKKDLQCGEKSSEDVLMHNCVGKHIMMLGLCKMNGWSLENYTDIEHPLQVKIKEKLTELCRLNHRFPIAKDSCGMPVISMPLENILWGYLNIFTKSRYSKIKDAFIKNPDLIGGDEALDTLIIKNSTGLVAKVGNGGLCVVVNTEKAEALIVKISDCNESARDVVVLKSLKNLHWADIDCETMIKTFSGEVVGEKVVL